MSSGLPRAVDGVLTPFRRPKAMYKPHTYSPLPTYLEKLRPLRDSSEANSWVVAYSKLR